MKGGDIEITQRDGQVEVVLDNASRRNAISRPMWEALRTFADKAREDATLRTVVIRGKGSIFSAGADITGFETGRSGDSAIGYDDLVELTLRALEELPQIIIAAIEGPCVGAGASLACACDIRVAKANSFFAVPAAHLGLGYDPRGIARFIRVFGESTTREMLLLAARIDAPRAHGLGAIHRLIEADSCEEYARTLAETASSLAPLTQKAAKLAIREIAAGKGISQSALDLAADADRSTDYAEGRKAFAEKRRPQFSGR